MSTTTLGYRVNHIIESFHNGQRKQMIEQYEDACKAFERQDVLLLLQLSESITEQELIKILVTLLNSESKGV